MLKGAHKSFNYVRCVLKKVSNSVSRQFMCEPRALDKREYLVIIRDNFC